MLFKYIPHLLYILFVELQNGLVGSFLFCALFCTSFSDSIDLLSDLKIDMESIIVIWPLFPNQMVRKIYIKMCQHAVDQ